MNFRKPQRNVVCLYDGFGHDYFERSPLPVMKRMAQEGIGTQSPGRFSHPHQRQQYLCLLRRLACGAWRDDQLLS